jgi:hypothetical protein
MCDIRLFLLPFLAPAAVACDRSGSAEQEQRDAMARQIAALEARVLKLEEAEADEGSKKQTQPPAQPPVLQKEPREASYVLLIDGQRGAVYSNKTGCEAAASELRAEADREQMRRDEYNRQEAAKPGPPGIIYGPAKRPKTNCISGG